MLNETEIRACAQYVMERAKHVITSFGPRPPGSEAEHKTQQLTRADLESCCDGEVSLEPFPVAQKAFFCMEAIPAALLAVAAVAFCVYPLMALPVDALALAVVYFQFYRYRLFLDPFFPKKTSHNVYGSIQPEGEVKRRVILAGHADAAYEWRFNYLAPKWLPLIFLVLFGGAVGAIGLHIAGTVMWALGYSTEVLQYAQLLFVPTVLVGLLFNNLRVVSPGANDNLTGTFISTGIARQLKESGKRLRHTELGVAIMGSEEAGLRGAKVFAKKHKEELQRVDTMVIVVETTRHASHLAVYNGDLNATVALDPAACLLLKEAGRARGIDMPYAQLIPGSTDAAAFAQEGFRTAVIAGVDNNDLAFYHTRRDNWDNMSEECIEAAIGVICEAITRFDAMED